MASSFTFATSGYLGFSKSSGEIVIISPIFKISGWSANAAIIAFLFPPTPAYTFPFILPRTIILPPAYTSAPLFTSPTITMFP